MIQDKIDQLKATFAAYSSWEDRYRHIIKIGKDLGGLNDSDKIEKYRIKGCQSQVWLKAGLENGIVHFYADSDAILVRGIIGVLIQVYNGHSPAEILACPTDFLKEIGITEHLSMNRTNGLASMVRQIQLYATAFNALIEKGVTNANP